MKRRFSLRRSGRGAAALLAGAILAGTVPCAAAANGFSNADSVLDMVQVARYESGMFNCDGGVMEIVDYNSDTGWAYAINGQTGRLAAISLSGLANTGVLQTLEGTDIDVKALVEDGSFVYGDMTSVATSPDNSTLAAAIQAAGANDDGRVALFACNGDGSLTFRQAIPVGKQPDMVTFTPDGSKILTANEGEPRDGYGADTTDPAGSVTVIDTATGDGVTVGFDAFDGAAERQALADAGVVLQKDTAPSVDLEPEYIAAGNDTAYVTLQEANAIAVLDLESNTFTGVYSAGFEDYSQVEVDIDKKDEAYAPRTYENLLGVRMPDAIALYTADGTDYLITANEGDAREWGDEDLGTDYLNEDERDFGDGESSPSGAITPENSGLTGKVVFLNSADYDGLEEGVDYLYGGRTFTVYAVESDGLREVFTSGSDFEALTARFLPDYFNASNDNAVVDDRSGKKGPEPESVTVGQVDGRTYAFVALERTGGVMAYDITDPERISFANYINTRDFSATVEGSQQYEDGELDKWVTGGDVAPEGLCFLPADQSPTGRALLLAACEVSGTVGVYELGQDIRAALEDVPAGSWYADAVAYVYEAGLMNGTEEGIFAPGQTLSRAMLAQILYNLEGQPAVGGTAFSDVEEDRWYADAVTWSAGNGLVSGYGDGTFGPNDPVTREQLVLFLYRYAGYKGQDTAQSGAAVLDFADAEEISSWALEAVTWAVDARLLSGKTGNLLDPRGSATRAEVAQILMNFLENNR